MTHKPHLMDHPCAACGGEVWERHGKIHRPRLYCSNRCARQSSASKAALNAARLSPASKAAARKNIKIALTHRFVSCKLNWRVCVLCGVEWLAAHRSVANRCDGCVQRLRRFTYYERITKPREGFRQRTGHCVVCGAEFVGQGGRAYCDACPDARTAVYRQAPERIRLTAIAERDGHRCWLCRTKVEPMDRSIDHVFPIARGGKHILSNVRLAHRRCNSIKRDKLVTAQLGLL